MKCSYQNIIMIIKGRRQSYIFKLVHNLNVNDVTLFQMIVLALILATILHGDDSYVQSFDDRNNNNVKLTQYGLELTQNVNIQRQEYMQRMCDTMGYGNLKVSNLTENQMRHMLIDDTNKFLYCYIPKVACTNWKRVLMLMTGQWTNGTDPLTIPATLAHSPNIFRKLIDLSEEEQNIVLSDYTRFILVRHPFERLLSAYRNKLKGSAPSARYFKNRIGNQIIQYFRHNPTNESLEKGDDVTFEEFIRYLLTPDLSMNTQTNQSFNEHWELASKLCSPCIIKYNVIGKYETLLDDSALALHLAGIKNITFPSGHKSAGTTQHLREYFDPVPIGIIRKLYKIYEDDFRLFDYSLENVLGYDFG